MTNQRSPAKRRGFSSAIVFNKNQYCLYDAAIDPLLRTDLRGDDMAAAVSRVPKSRCPASL